MSKEMTWALTDHLCKSCGGRVLRCVGGSGPTPGGNPLYKCADCGKSVAAMGSDALCWCGYSHKHNHNATAYVCKPFAILQDHPEFLRAFQACGCDPKRGGEVGIMLERDFKEIWEKLQAA